MIVLDYPRDISLRSEAMCRQKRHITSLMRRLGRSEQEIRERVDRALGFAGLSANAPQRIADMTGHPVAAVSYLGLGPMIYPRYWPGR